MRDSNIIKKFCNFIFGKHKSNTLPRYWILIADMVIVIAAFVLAIFMLYFRDIGASGYDWSRIWIVLAVYLIAFLATRTYDGMLRYSGMEYFGLPTIFHIDLPLSNHLGFNDYYATHYQALV